MISHKAKYAIRALIALAELGPGETLQIAGIAEAQAIPKKFLEQILLELKRRGLVASRRGAHGGYALLKPAQAITFTEVLRIIDGPIAPLPCLSEIAYRRCEDCLSESACSVRRAFAAVAEAQRDVLSATTIASASASLRRRPRRAPARAVRNRGR